MPGYGYLCLGMIFIKSESTHHNLSTIYSLLPKISNRELSLPPLSIFPVIASPLPFFLSLRLPHFSPVIVAPFFLRHYKPLPPSLRSLTFSLSLRALDGAKQSLTPSLLLGRAIRDCFGCVYTLAMTKKWSSFNEKKASYTISSYAII